MRIYSATNERQFNEAFNDLLGTTGVAYSAAWPMNIRNGKEYMREYGMSVGQIYASQLLHGKVTSDSCLAPLEDEQHMTPKQRAYLSCMHDTTDAETYTAALNACSNLGAVPDTAIMLFGSTISAGREIRVRPAIQVAPVVQALPRAASPVPFRAVPRAASPVQLMEVDEQHTPSRVRLNSPPSAQRSLTLHASKRRKKK